MGRRFRISRRTTAMCVSLVCSTCLVGAGLNHANDIRNGGWLPYHGAPLPMNVYWTTLAALDPLAAAMIWFKPRIGFATTLAIMVSDVAINSYGVHWLGYHGWHACGSLQLQAMFLGFVVGSLPWCRAIRGNVNRNSGDNGLLGIAHRDDLIPGCFKQVGRDDSLTVSATGNRLRSAMPQQLTSGGN